MLQEKGMIYKYGFGKGAEYATLPNGLSLSAEAVALFPSTAHNSPEGGTYG
jgi:hypothetical protein